VNTLDWQLESVNWANLRAAHGKASEVPAALRRLATAVTEGEARAASWELDTSLAIQGRLFEAAEYVVPPLLQLLCRGRATTCWYVLDLLYQLTGPAAYVDPSETERGNAGLVDRCRRLTREGLAVIYWMLDSDDPKVRVSASELLAQVDEDTNRLASRLERMARTDQERNVREQASHIVTELGRPRAV
jgi:hypothetical protein